VWTLNLVLPGTSRQFWEFSRRFFGGWMLREVRQDRGVVPQVQQAGGQDGGNTAVPLIEGEGGEFVVRLHRTSTRRKRPQRPSSGDRSVVWRIAKNDASICYLPGRAAR
jgi:hypothetical protein